MSGANPIRVAMWSGPRNISTAMMRSWENRDDTVVVDEPLYAHYLHVTRKPHPGIDETIAAGETDWRKVVAQLIGESRPLTPSGPEAENGPPRQNISWQVEPHSAPVPRGARGLPSGKPVYFQKHMTHHLLAGMDRQWLAQLTNCFLIRDPREVLASYTKVIDTPTLEDLGFLQQTEIFEFVRQQTGREPPVLDAADVLRDPRRMLGQLCDAIGIEFQEAMLAWPPGPRATDGAWAKYWYAEVEKSTGFRPYQPKEIQLSEQRVELGEECMPHYDLLHRHRLR